MTLHAVTPAALDPAQMLLLRFAGMLWPTVAQLASVDVTHARDLCAAFIDAQQQEHDHTGRGMDDTSAAAAWMLLED